MSLFLFIIILVVLILVHEFGHFIVAKRAGIRVDEFSIGFGPTLWSIKRGETRYMFKALLLGGYVKIFGENPNQDSLSGPESARSFVNQPKLVQTAVITAGVIFNILLAWVIFSAIFMTGMPTSLSEDEIASAQNVRLVIADVLEDTPADRAGLTAGDVITGLEKEGGENETLTTLTGSAFIDYMSAHGTQPVTLSFTRGDEEMSVTITPKENIVPENPDQSAIGVSLGLVGEQRFAPHIALWEGARFTYEMTGLIAVGLFGFFTDIAVGSADFSQVAGPIGIVSLVGSAAELGVVSLLLFTAFISINLAVINILPFPALDGGRLLFIIIETIKGSPIKPSIANAVNALGFILLILLMIVVTYGDILKLGS